MISNSTAASPQRPHHQRNKSSRSGLLKSLVPSKSRPSSPEPSPSRRPLETNHRTKTVPILPPDHPHASAAKSRPLGERQHNARSPPSSPSKTTKTTRAPIGSTSPRKDTQKDDRMRKQKSSTGLSSVFGKMNRSKSDLSFVKDAAVEKDKENNRPASAAQTPVQTPIWAQFSTAVEVTPKERSAHRDRDSLQAEIARYTPQNYSPSKQRNFHGTFEQPLQRPTLHSRPQSMYKSNEADLLNCVSRRLSDGRSSVDSQRPGRLSHWRSSESSKAGHVIDKGSRTPQADAERKISGSSAEDTPSHDMLTVNKRGGRVMAAVAAFQGKIKGREASDKKEEPPLDAKAVERAFEEVLEARNIPEAMREKMRTLTLRVKADFVKQDQSSARSSGPSPPGSLTTAALASNSTIENGIDHPSDEADSKATKRSRPRSRTFTFSKSTKQSEDSSPTKRDRGTSRGRESRSRPTSIHVPKDAPTDLAAPRTPTTPGGRKTHTSTAPADFIAYLQKIQEPAKVEVGRLHKLRILLRNETVAWVDTFISLGGMTEIVALLTRIMAVEWREEHEDQLLHETLLCLKGLCTTERALAELEKIADKLFPALVRMLFDEEKKGPAEYTTRTVIIQLLFKFLATAIDSSAEALEQRARRTLAYIGEPSKPEDAQPVGFVLEMRTRRPYKPWCQEVSNVTKEVFWIFLHHLNVISLPRPNSSARPGTSERPPSANGSNNSEQAKILASTYARRHFPGIRPPVPAAPYIGGVEWDATTYLTAHLDLLNGLLASLSTAEARNELRAELQASGFEKVMGATMRTCKEKFYGGVHDGLRSWVAAAAEDGWDTRFVREGPTQEEQADRAKKILGSSPAKSPAKRKDEQPPKLSLGAPKLDLQIDGIDDVKKGNDNDDAWLI